MRVEIRAALIAAASVLIGNIITAFGPAFISWGQKPIFANSEIYKDLKKENPQLEATLQDQLLQRKIYYTSRRTEVEFLRIEDGNVVIAVKNITTLRNGTEDSQKYSHTISTNGGENYTDVKIRPATSLENIFSFTKEQIDEMACKTKPLSRICTFPEIEIPAHGTATIESRYIISKPKLLGSTTLVTGRLLNAPMTVNIKNNIQDKAFLIGWDSLAFDPNLPSDEMDGKREVSINIPGPIFSGQGLLLMWEQK